MYVILFASYNGSTKISTNSADRMGDATMDRDATRRGRPCRVLHRGRSRAGRVTTSRRRRMGRLRSTLGTIGFCCRRFSNNSTLVKMDPGYRGGRGRKGDYVIPIICIFNPSISPVTYVKFSCVNSACLSVSAIRVSASGCECACKGAAFVASIRGSGLAVSPGNSRGARRTTFHLTARSSLSTLISVIRSSRINLAFTGCGATGPIFMRYRVPRRSERTVASILGTCCLCLGTDRGIHTGTLTSVSCARIRS